MYYCGAHSGLTPIWREGGLSACFLDTLCSATALTFLLLGSLRIFSGKKVETYNVIGAKVCTENELRKYACAGTANVIICARIL